MVLGTGAPQADLIRALKENNWEVHACSYRTGDPGEKIADYFSLINITDIDTVKEYCSINKIDLIYSAGSDIAMPTAFAVSEMLGLPSFCSAETAIICNTKTILREKLGKDYVGNIPYQKMRDKTDVIKISFPLIIKPADSQGQRGVFRVDSYAELLSSFDVSMSFSRCKEVILEKCILGNEISVNTFSCGGEVVFFLPSERIVWPGLSGGIIHKHILPGKWANNKEAMERVKTLVEDTLLRLRIFNGPAYFQIMLDNEGMPYLIEVTPRLDGCHMWRLINYATGVNLLDLTIKAICGIKIKEIPQYAVIPYETEFFCQPPDTVFKIGSFELGPYDYLEWYYREGETVHRMNGYMEKCGYAIRRLTEK